MTSSSNRPSPANILLAILGAAYPFIVYASLGRIPAGALVLVAVALVGLRIGLADRGATSRRFVPPLIVAAAITGGLGLADAATATRIYPVLMSLAFASAFGWSLRTGPSLVETLARPFEPDPSPAAQAYMRGVTKVWLAFLIANAGISAATAFADPWLWALYNGLVSYLLMAALFAGEWLVRRRIRSREGLVS